MKHKRETGEREVMQAMIVIVSKELRQEVIELFGCLFTYSLDRTKQNDRYRSSEIHHYQSSNSSSNGGINGGSNGGNSINFGSSISIKEEEIPCTRVFNPKIRLRFLA